MIDCDKVKSACKNSAASFGTFPQAVGSSRQSATKVSVADIKFDKKLVNGDSRGSSIGAGSGLDNKMKRNETPSSDGYTILDITESLYETIPDDIEPTPASKASPRGRSSAGSSGGSRKGRGGSSASNSSERGGGGGGRKTSLQNQTQSPPARASTKMVAKKITLPGKSDEKKDNGLDDSVSSTSDDGDTSGNSGGLNDSTAMEGFRAIALLNDVLRDYADLNESSTDDFFSDSQSITTTATTLSSSSSSSAAAKSKKQPPLPPVSAASSTDFEAKMASVAATLDLTKPNQRGGGKRQAPRPPVSPPPEPGASPKRPATGGKENQNQPEPNFKMVPVGRSIMPLPPPQQQPGDPPLANKSGKTGSNAPAGLEEFALPSDGSQESLSKVR